MQLGKILLLLGLTAMSAAENDVERDDVPSACLPACQFTIDLSARCDRQTNNDNEYTPCVCEAQDSKMRLTECASCVKDNGRSDPDDNDVADLMDDCGWNFNEADVPYPISWSTTTTAAATISSPSTASVGSIVTGTENPSGTSLSDSTTTVTNTPTSSTALTASTSAPDSKAGILGAKAFVGPLLAGLVIGLPVML
ncbi:hypothetical protein F5Y12DRAFT_82878 [Xylaria sp. FL1777]|nr:hypothetical protein F5Y12DRAFT_82878 [Xylaria sp. FL1777]